MEFRTKIIGTITILAIAFGGLTGLCEYDLNSFGGAHMVPATNERNGGVMYNGKEKRKYFDENADGTLDYVYIRRGFGEKEISKKDSDFERHLPEFKEAREIFLGKKK